MHIYKKHQKDTLYESVMDVIVRANHEKFKEVSGMCEALVEIMQPYIDEQVAIRTALRIKKEKQKVAEYVAECEQKAAEYVAECEAEYEQKVAECVAEREQKVAELTAITELTRILLAAGRIEDLSRAMDDEEYRNYLYGEFALL